MRSACGYWFWRYLRRTLKVMNTYVFLSHVNYLSRAYWEKACLVGIWIKVSCVLSLYSWLKASFLLHDFNVSVVATATKILLCKRSLELRMYVFDFHRCMYVVGSSILWISELLFHRWGSAARVKSSGEPLEKVRSPSATRLNNQLCVV
jgi:hypothetical protein